MCGGVVAGGGHIGALVNEGAEEERQCGGCAEEHQLADRAGGISSND